MRKAKIFFIVIVMLFIITSLTACAEKPTINTNGEEVVIDFANISEVSVLNQERLKSEGFLLETFKISDIVLHIVYFNETSVDIPMAEYMVKAECQSYLKVPGTHKISAIYGGKFNFEFMVKLYQAETNKFEITFYDETGERIIGTPQLLEEGEIALPPTLPTKEGYSHIGWANKVGGLLITDFTAKKSIAYVAVYRPDYYQVNFYYTVGEKNTLIKSVSVPRGGNALDYAPAIPIISGYSNGRWANEEGMASVDEGNTDFYAIYDSDKVPITFSYYKYNEGEYYDYNISWEVDLETEGVTPPDDVEKIANYVFLYWYVERGNKEVKVTFPYRVTGEMKFKAKYVSYNSGTESLIYELSDDGTYYKITGLNAGNTDEIAVIPQTHLGLPVKEIEDGAFSYTGIKKFAVSSTNPYFRAYDGTLYVSSLNELVAYPVLSNRELFEVEEKTKLIRPYAFRGAKYLTEIKLGNKIEEIGEGAFSECKELKELNIPEGVVVIESGLIQNSKKLRKLHIGNSVTEIKDRAFYGASVLENVVLPYGLQKLGDEVFAYCDGLYSITIGTGTSNTKPNFTVSGGALYGYNDGAVQTNEFYFLYAYPAKFSGGSNSAEYALNINVRVIKKGAFINSVLSGIYISSTDVTFNEKSVISPFIKSLRFNGGSITFENNAFAEETPSKIYVTGNTIINNADGLDTVIYEGTGSPYREFIQGYSYELNEDRMAVITSYKGKDKIVEIPEKINTFTVVGIEEQAFSGNLTIEEIVFPDGLKKIGKCAFSGCESLKKVTFGSGLISIGADAFIDCGDEIEFIGDLATIISLGNNAFGNFSLSNYDENGVVCVAGVVLGYVGYKKTVIIPEKATIIADNAFANATFIDKIDFTRADNLLLIKENAFSNCEEITALEFPDSLKEIEERAFFGCSRLIEINNTPESGVASNAFEGIGTDSSVCWEIEDDILIGYKGNSSIAVIPNGVVGIADRVFANNDKIKVVVLNKELKEIGNYSFENCEELTTFIPTENLTVIGESAFLSCNKLQFTNLNKATKISEIAYNAFDGTEWLINYIDDSILINDIFYKYQGTSTELHILNSVQKINERAFYNNTTLETVYIPESINCIGKYAFANSNIANFNFAQNATRFEEIGESAFENCVNLSFLDIRALTGLREIGKRAFYGIKSPYSGVLHIYIPSSVYSIGESAFENSRIDTIRFSDGSLIGRLNDRVFYDCENLESVIFEGSSKLSEIGNSAFENCINLKIFNNFDCKISTIGEKAFAGNNALVNFKISDSLLSNVGKDAFSDNGFINNNDDTMIFMGTVLVKYNATLSETVIIPAKTTVIGNSAFANNTHIRNIIFQTEEGKTNLVEIQDKAFTGCASLISIDIPDTVKIIGVNAFENCLSLENLAFGDNLKEIGYGAFAYCSSLTEVNLPSSLESFEGAVFVGCNNLSEINIQNSAKFYTEDGIFYGYKSDKVDGIPNRTAVLLAYPNGRNANNQTFRIPERLLIKDIVYYVDSIGNYAFAGCSENALAQITINSKIINIGEKAFSGVTADIQFEENSIISTIFDYGFAEYLGTNLVIPSSVTSLGNNVFDNAINIDSVVIPSNVLSIGGYAFANTDMEILWEEGCKLETLSDYTYKNYMGDELIVPQSVIEIGKRAFEGVTAKIIIEAPLTSIGDYAFYGYNGIETPIIPENVTTIGQYAFANMPNLSSDISIPSSVNYIGKYAFENVSVGINFAENASINKIGNYAFANYLGESISLPNDVTEFGAYALAGCKNLSSVLFGNKVKVVGEYAFNKTKINYLHLPNSIIEIGGNAFSDNTELKSVVFGSNSSLASIGIGVFENCNSIQSISIPFVGEKETSSNNTFFGYIFGGKNYSDNSNKVPSTLKKVKVLRGTIACNAFYACKYLTELEFMDSVIHIGEGSLIGCESLVKLNAPYGGIIGMLFGADKYTNNNNYMPSGLNEIVITRVNEISDNAFYNCTGIISVILPENLTKIGNTAFYNCSRLSKMEIGENVAFIGKSAFARCSSLADINVDKNNEKYVDFDGVLYEYDFIHKTAVLVAYPQKRAGKEYKIALNIGEDEYMITSLGNYAFYYSEITDIVIPESLTEMGEYAFAYSRIKSIRILNYNLGRNAFTGCKQLKTVYVENSEIVISPDNEFDIFDNSNAVYVEKSLENNVRNTTFIYNNFTKLTTETTNETMITNKFGKEYVVYYDSTLPNGTKPISVNIRINNTYGSVKLNDEPYNADSYFIEGTELEFEAVPMNDYVFVGWFGNEELLSSNEKFIYTVVNRNIALSARFLYVGVGVETEWEIEETGDASLAGDESIVYYLVSSDDSEFASQKILLFEGQGELGYLSSEHVSHQTMVTSIKIGNGITDICNSAFEYFSLLKTISLSDTVSSIGERAYANCTALTAINISDGVVNIKESAFDGCSKVSTIELGVNVKSIGERAFAGIAVKEILLPKTVIYFSNTAMAECRLLSKIEVENGNSTYVDVEGVLFSYDKDTKEGSLVLVPIGKQGYLIIPDTFEVNCLEYIVKSIYDLAFYNCQLNKVTISKNINSIGLDVFMGSRINEVIIKDDSLFIVIDKILYSYSGITGNNIAKIIYNYSGTTAPLTVQINGDEYFVQ